MKGFNFFYNIFHELLNHIKDINRPDVLSLLYEKKDLLSKVHSDDIVTSLMP